MSLHVDLGQGSESGWGVWLGAVLGTMNEHSWNTRAFLASSEPLSNLLLNRASSTLTTILCGCFHKLGIPFVGVPIMKALLFRGLS